ncbi:MAG: hypothetical protein PHE88_08805 [Elusimicrobia bacterium]|nr:hypothetical protein [Elusimicrobiota bacterium]
MANQSDHNKWADEIFNNALNQAQAKGFRILDDNVNESIIKSKEEEIINLRDSLEEIKNTLKQELQNVKKKLVEREDEQRPKEFRDLQATKARLETALKHLKNKLEIKQVEIEEKEKKFTELLKEKLDEKTKDLKKWHEMESFNLTEKIKAQNGEIEDLKSHVKQWQMETKRREGELILAKETLEKEREHWLESVRVKENEIRGLKSYISQREEEIEKKKRDISDLEFQMAQRLGEAKEKELKLVAAKEHLEKEIELLNNIMEDEKSPIIKAGMIKREARIKAEQYKKEEELKVVKQQLEDFRIKSQNEKLLWEEKLKNSEGEIKRLNSEVEQKEKRLGSVEASLDKEIKTRRNGEEEKNLMKSQIILNEAELKAKHVAGQQDLVAIKVALEREREELKKRMAEERIYWQERVKQISSGEAEMQKNLKSLQKEYDGIEQKLLAYERELVLEKEKHKTWEELKEAQLKTEYQKKIQQLEEQEAKWKEEKIDGLYREMELENKELEKGITEEETEK